MSLAVVIPLFNEEKTIGLLIKDLHTLLASQHIEHQFIIINDGSTDSSLTILELLSASIPGMQIITHKNCGHGPSLLSGYNLALKQEWVFQLDSDYQYDLAAFNLLWKNKQDYDLLIAERKQRNASIPRDIATAVSQGLVRFLYGRGLIDINSPYRLMRAEKLALVLPHIKVNSFAPNILISAYFLKKKFRIFTTGADQLVNVSERKSKMSIYIFKGCLKSFSDTFLFRFKI